MTEKNCPTSSNEAPRPASSAERSAPSAATRETIVSTNLSHAQIAFVEMQPAIVAFSRTQPADALCRAARTTNAMAETLGIPVTASVVALQDESTHLIAELSSLEARVRTSISLFADSAVRDRIVRSGRKVLALAGVSAEIAILHTALDARRAGFDVHLLTDCCGGLDSRSERAAFAQMQSAGVVMSSVSTFFTGLVTDVMSDEGTAVMRVLAGHWSWNKAAA